MQERLGSLDFAKKHKWKKEAPFKNKLQWWDCEKVNGN